MVFHHNSYHNTQNQTQNKTQRHNSQNTTKRQTSQLTTLWTTSNSKTSNNDMPSHGLMKNTREDLSQEDKSCWWNGFPPLCSTVWFSRVFSIEPFVHPAWLPKQRLSTNESIPKTLPWVSIWNFAAAAFVSSLALSNACFSLCSKSRFFGLRIDQLCI
jgi:hypothetical protein